MRVKRDYRVAAQRSAPAVDAGQDHVRTIVIVVVVVVSVIVVLLSVGTIIAAGVCYFIFGQQYQMTGPKIIFLVFAAILALVSIGLFVASEVMMGCGPKGGKLRPPSFMPRLAVPISFAFVTLSLALYCLLSAITLFVVWNGIFTSESEKPPSDYFLLAPGMQLVSAIIVCILEVLYVEFRVRRMCGFKSPAHFPYALMSTLMLIYGLLGVAFWQQSFGMSASGFAIATSIAVPIYALFSVLLSWQSVLVTCVMSVGSTLLSFVYAMLPIGLYFVRGKGDDFANKHHTSVFPFVVILGLVAAALHFPVFNKSGKKDHGPARRFFGQVVIGVVGLFLTAYVVLSSVLGELYGATTDFYFIHPEARIPGASGPAVALIVFAVAFLPAALRTSLYLPPVTYAFAILLSSAFVPGEESKTGYAFSFSFLLPIALGFLAIVAIFGTRKEYIEPEEEVEPEEEEEGEQYEAGKKPPTEIRILAFFSKAGDKIKTGCSKVGSDSYSFTGFMWQNWTFVLFVIGAFVVGIRTHWSFVAVGDKSNHVTAKSDETIFNRYGTNIITWIVLGLFGVVVAMRGLGYLPVSLGRLCSSKFPRRTPYPSSIDRTLGSVWMVAAVFAVGFLCSNIHYSKIDWLKSKIWSGGDETFTIVHLIALILFFVGIIASAICYTLVVILGRAKKHFDVVRSLKKVERLSEPRTYGFVALEIFQAICQLGVLLMSLHGPVWFVAMCMLLAYTFAWKPLFLPIVNFADGHALAAPRVLRPAALVPFFAAYYISFSYSSSCWTIAGLIAAAEIFSTRVNIYTLIGVPVATVFFAVLVGTGFLWEEDSTTELVLRWVVFGLDMAMLLLDTIWGHASRMIKNFKAQDSKWDFNGKLVTAKEYPSVLGGDLRTAFLQLVGLLLVVPYLADDDYDYVFQIVLVVTWIFGFRGGARVRAADGSVRFSANLLRFPLLVPMIGCTVAMFLGSIYWPIGLLVPTLQLLLFPTLRAFDSVIFLLFACVLLFVDIPMNRLQRFEKGHTIPALAVRYAVGGIVLAATIVDRVVAIVRFFLKKRRAEQQKVAAEPGADGEAEADDDGTGFELTTLDPLGTHLYHGGLVAIVAVMFYPLVDTYTAGLPWLYLCPLLLAYWVTFSIDFRASRPAKECLKDGALLPKVFRPAFIVTVLAFIWMMIYNRVKYRASAAWTFLFFVVGLEAAVARRLKFAAVNGVIAILFVVAPIVCDLLLPFKQAKEPAYKELWWSFRISVAAFLGALLPVTSVFWFWAPLVRHFKKTGPFFKTAKGWFFPPSDVAKKASDEDEDEADEKLRTEISKSDAPTDLFSLMTDVVRKAKPTVEFSWESFGLFGLEFLQAFLQCGALFLLEPFFYFGDAGLPVDTHKMFSGWLGWIVLVVIWLFGFKTDFVFFMRKTDGDEEEEEEESEDEDEKEPSPFRGMLSLPRILRPTLLVPIGGFFVLLGGTRSAFWLVLLPILGIELLFSRRGNVLFNAGCAGILVISLFAMDYFYIARVMEYIDLMSPVRWVFVLLVGIMILADNIILHVKNWGKLRRGHQLLTCPLPKPRPKCNLKSIGLIAPEIRQGFLMAVIIALTYPLLFEVRASLSSGSWPFSLIYAGVMGAMWLASFKLFGFPIAETVGEDGLPMTIKFPRLLRPTAIIPLVGFLLLVFWKGENPLDEENLPRMALWFVALLFIFVEAVAELITSRGSRIALSVTIGVAMLPFIIGDSIGIVQKKAPNEIVDGKLGGWIFLIFRFVVGAAALTLVVVDNIGYHVQMIMKKASIFSRACWKSADDEAAAVALSEERELHEEGEESEEEGEVHVADYKKKYKGGVFRDLTMGEAVKMPVTWTDAWPLSVDVFHACLQAVAIFLFYPLLLLKTEFASLFYFVAMLGIWAVSFKAEFVGLVWFERGVRFVLPRAIRPTFLVPMAGFWLGLFWKQEPYWILGIVPVLVEMLCSRRPNSLINSIACATTLIFGFVSEFLVRGGGIHLAKREDYSDYFWARVAAAIVIGVVLAVFAVLRAIHWIRYTVAFMKNKHEETPEKWKGFKEVKPGDLGSVGEDCFVATLQALVIFLLYPLAWSAPSWTYILVVVFVGVLGFNPAFLPVLEFTKKRGLIRVHGPGLLRPAFVVPIIGFVVVLLSTKTSHLWPFVLVFIFLEMELSAFFRTRVFNLPVFFILVPVFVTLGMIFGFDLGEYTRYVFAGLLSAVLVFDNVREIVSWMIMMFKKPEGSDFFTGEEKAHSAPVVFSKCPTSWKDFVPGDLSPLATSVYHAALQVVVMVLLHPTDSNMTISHPLYIGLCAVLWVASLKPEFLIAVLSGTRDRISVPRFLDPSALAVPIALIVEGVWRRNFAHFFVAFLLCAVGAQLGLPNHRWANGTLLFLFSMLLVGLSYVGWESKKLSSTKGKIAEVILYICVPLPLVLILLDNGFSFLRSLLLLHRRRIRIQPFPIQSDLPKLGQKLGCSSPGEDNCCSTCLTKMVATTSTSTKKKVVSKDEDDAEETKKGFSYYLGDCFRGYFEDLHHAALMIVSFVAMRLLRIRMSVMAPIVFVQWLVSMKPFFSPLWRKEKGETKAYVIPKILRPTIIAAVVEFMILLWDLDSAADKMWNLWNLAFVCLLADVWLEHNKHTLFTLLGSVVYLVPAAIKEMYENDLFRFDYTREELLSHQDMNYEPPKGYVASKMSVSVAVLNDVKLILFVGLGLLRVFLKIVPRGKEAPTEETPDSKDMQVKKKSRRWVSFRNPIKSYPASAFFMILLSVVILTTHMYQLAAFIGFVFLCFCIVFLFPKNTVYRKSCYLIGCLVFLVRCLPDVVTPAPDYGTVYAGLTFVGLTIWAIMPLFPCAKIRLQIPDMNELFSGFGKLQAKKDGCVCSSAEKLADAILNVILYLFRALIVAILVFGPAAAYFGDFSTYPWVFFVALCVVGIYIVVFGIFWGGDFFTVMLFPAYVLFGFLIPMGDHQQIFWPKKNVWGIDGQSIDAGPRGGRARLFGIPFAISALVAFVMFLLGRFTDIFGISSLFSLEDRKKNKTLQRIDDNIWEVLWLWMLVMLFALSWVEEYALNIPSFVALGMIIIRGLITRSPFQFFLGIVFSCLQMLYLSGVPPIKYRTFDRDWADANDGPYGYKGYGSYVVMATTLIVSFFSAMIIDLERARQQKGETTKTKFYSRLGMLIGHTFFSLVVFLCPLFLLATGHYDAILIVLQVLVAVYSLYIVVLLGNYLFMAVFPFFTFLFVLFLAKPMGGWKNRNVQYGKAALYGVLAAWIHAALLYILSQTGLAYAFRSPTAKMLLAYPFHRMSSCLKSLPCCQKLATKAKDIRWFGPGKLSCYETNRRKRLAVKEVELEDTKVEPEEGKTEGWKAIGLKQDVDDREKTSLRVVEVLESVDSDEEEMEEYTEEEVLVEQEEEEEAEQEEEEEGEEEGEGSDVDDVEVMVVEEGEEYEEEEEEEEEGTVEEEEEETVYSSESEGEVVSDAKADASDDDDDDESEIDEDVPLSCGRYFSLLCTELGQNVKKSFRNPVSKNLTFLLLLIVAFLSSFTPTFGAAPILSYITLGIYCTVYRLLSPLAFIPGLCCCGVLISSPLSFAMWGIDIDGPGRYGDRDVTWIFSMMVPSGIALFATCLLFVVMPAARSWFAPKYDWNNPDKTVLDTEYSDEISILMKLAGDLGLCDCKAKNEKDYQKCMTHDIVGLLRFKSRVDTTTYAWWRLISQTIFFTGMMVGVYLLYMGIIFSTTKEEMWYTTGPVWVTGVILAVVEIVLSFLMKTDQHKHLRLMVGLLRMLVSLGLASYTVGDKVGFDEWYSVLIVFLILAGIMGLLTAAVFIYLLLHSRRTQHRK